MARTLSDVMTKEVASLQATASCLDAARQMRERSVGDVVVTKEDGSLCGILTDRDIVVRCVADGGDPAGTKVGDLCSGELTTLGPDAEIDAAVQVMKDNAVRRIPVVDGSKLVGIVSIGDLAEERDPRSALGKISAAPPNA